MSVFRDIEVFRARGYDPSTIEEAKAWNAQWQAFLASPMAPYLRYGDPQQLWKHPEGPLLDLASIARSAQELAPDATLFKFGFLPVWTSGGGNVIAYHPHTKAFYWAHHESVFGFEEVMVPSTYEMLPLNQENLMKALVRLSDEDCGTYLRNLRDGLYEEKLDRLD